MVEKPPDVARKIVLTQRETEALEWASVGKSNWEIGEILGISETTAKEHVLRACRKLETTNRTHACVKAAVLGLISPPIEV